MTTEIATILKDNELEGASAELIAQSFAPILEKLDTWSAKARALVVTDISQKDEMKEAKAARLVFKNLRVDSRKKKDELKADALKYNKVIQSIYNMIEERITPIEDHLREQEEFEIRDEQRRQAVLNDERWAYVREQGLQDYVAVNENLGEYAKLGFEHFMGRCRDQKALDEKAEADRLEQERLDKEENDRLRKENEDLRVANEKRQERTKEILATGVSFDGTNFYLNCEVARFDCAASEVLELSDKRYPGYLNVLKHRVSEILSRQKEQDDEKAMKEQQDFEKAEEQRKADEKKALQQRFTARSKHLLQNGFEEEFGDFYHKGKHTISWDTVEKVEDAKFYAAITHIDNEIQRQKDQEAEDARMKQEAEEKAAKAAPDLEKIKKYLDEIEGIEFPELTAVHFKLFLRQQRENFLFDTNDYFFPQNK